MNNSVAETKISGACLVQGVQQAGVVLRSNKEGGEMPAGQDAPCRRHPICPLTNRLNTNEDCNSLNGLIDL